MLAALQFMDKFGCTPIPDIFKQTRVEESLPLSFGLVKPVPDPTFCGTCIFYVHSNAVFLQVGQTDEMILPLALLQWMTGKHNEFVQRIDEVLLLRQKESQRYATANPNLSSSLVTKTHALDYDADLVEDFVGKQCVERSSRGAVPLDSMHVKRVLTLARNALSCCRRFVL